MDYVKIFLLKARETRLPSQRHYSISRANLSCMWCVALNMIIKIGKKKEKLCPNIGFTKDQDLLEFYQVMLDFPFLEQQGVNEQTDMG